MGTATVRAVEFGIDTDWAAFADPEDTLDCAVEAIWTLGLGTELLASASGTGLGTRRDKKVSILL